MDRPSQPRQPVYFPETEELKIQFGEILRKLRIARGLSQKALGNLVGVTEQQIYNYEHGINSPGDRVLDKLVRVLALTNEEALDLHKAAGKMTGLVRATNELIHTLRAEMDELKAKHREQIKSATDHLIAIYAPYVDDIHLAKAEGDAHRSIRMADNSIPHLIAFAAETHSDAAREELLRLCMGALHGKGHSLSPVSPPGILWTANADVIAKLELIRALSNDESLKKQCSYLTTIFEADARYVVRDTVAAIKQSQLAGNDLVTTVDDQLWKLAALAKSFARRGLSSEYKQIEEQIRGILDSGQCQNREIAVFSYTVFPHARITLRDLDAEKAYLEARQNIERLTSQFQSAPYMEIHLLVSEFLLTRGTNSILGGTIYEMARRLSHARLMARFENYRS